MPNFEDGPSSNIGLVNESNNEPELIHKSNVFFDFFEPEKIKGELSPRFTRRLRYGDVYIYSNCLRVKHQDRIVVEYPCDYDSKKKRVMRIDIQAVWWTASISRQLVFFSQALYRIVYFVKTARRMQAVTIGKKATQSPLHRDGIR